MAKNEIEIPDIGKVNFYKLKNAKSIKLKISGSKLKVTLPNWVPYKVAQNYVINKTEWIKDNLKPKLIINNGQLIGKNYKLHLISTDSSRISSSTRQNMLIIKIPSSLDLGVEKSQIKIQKIIKSALLTESEELLIPLIRQKAVNLNVLVNKIEIKDLKSRWGSCSSQNDIAISLYLIQYPWKYINYVIYHELAHTIHHNHSNDFWNLLGSWQPNYKQLRYEMKSLSPEIINQA